MLNNSFKCHSKHLDALDLRYKNHLSRLRSSNSRHNFLSRNNQVLNMSRINFPQTTSNFSAFRIKEQSKNCIEMYNSFLEKQVNDRHATMKTLEFDMKSNF